MASIRLAGRTEELGPFSSKKGNTLAWRIQPPRNVFSDRGSADCGPSRTGGSVYFAAKLGKHCAFWEKEKDKDELGKKRKKKKKPRLSSMLHCRILSLSASSQLTIFIVNRCLAKTSEKCRSVVLHPPCRNCYYTISKWRRFRFNDRTRTLLFRMISLPQLLKCFLVCLYPPFQSIW